MEENSIGMSSLQKKILNQFTANELNVSIITFSSSKSYNSASASENKRC